MKIIFLSLYGYPKIGGVEKHIHRLQKIAKNKGDELYHVCYDSEKVGSFDKYNLRIKGLFKTKLKTLNLFFSFQYLYFRNIKLFNSVDIIHLHDSGMIFWFLPQLLFSKNRKKTFITFHGWWGVYPLPFLEKMIFKIASFLTRNTGCIYVGGFLDKHFTILNNNKILIYGGVEKKEIDIYKNINNNNLQLSNRKKITFFGRLEKDLDFEYFINLINTIKNPNDYEIIILGNGRLQKMVKNLNSNFLINNVGFLENPYFILNNSDIIFTSGYLGILESLYLNKQIISLYNNNLKKDYLTYNNIYKNYIQIVDTNKSNDIDNILQGRKINIYSANQIPDFEEVYNKYLELYNNKNA